MATREQLLAIKALQDKWASATQAQSILAKWGSATNIPKTEAQQRVENFQTAQSNATQNKTNQTVTTPTTPTITPETPATVPTWTEDFENLFASLWGTAAQQEAQKALQALLSQPTETPAWVEWLQEQRADIAWWQAALARQITEQEWRITWVWEQLWAEWGELTSIARWRIEEARTAPLREQMTKFITQKEEFWQTISDIDKSIDRTLDFARTQRNDEVKRIEDFIKASWFTPQQQSLLNEMVKQKSKELFDTDAQEASLLKQAMRTRDISQLPEDLQVDFIESAVDDILKQPLFKWVTTQRPTWKIVSDILARIQWGETLDEALERDLLQPLREKPEVKAQQEEERLKVERQRQLVSKWAWGWVSAPSWDVKLTNSQRLRIAKEAWMDIKDVPFTVWEVTDIEWPIRLPQSRILDIIVRDKETTEGDLF